MSANLLDRINEKRLETEIAICQVTGCIENAVDAIALRGITRRLCERHRARIVTILEQPDRARRAA